MYQPRGGATFGNLIWQDVAAGTRISPVSTKEVVVTVYYSLGQAFLTKLDSEREIPEFIYNENLKSANFTYEVQYVNDVADKGTIIEMSPSNQFVDPGQHIVFKVSKGS